MPKMIRERTATPPIAMPAMAPPLRDDEEGGEMKEVEVVDGVGEAFEGTTYVPEIVGTADAAEVLELLGRLEEDDCKTYMMSTY